MAKTDPVLDDKAVQWMMDDIGVDIGQHQGAIHGFINDTAMVESSGNPKAANKKSSARGLFQWLTKPNSKSGESVYQEDLKATKLYYKKAGESVPQWVEDGLKDNDPTKLSKAEQAKLFLFRMYRMAPNAELKEAYTGDKQRQVQVYSDYHHTNPDEATKDVVEKTFGVRPASLTDVQPLEDAIAAEQPLGPNVPQGPNDLSMVGGGMFGQGVYQQGMPMPAQMGQYDPFAVINDLNKTYQF